MRNIILMAALGAAMCVGCGDDDGNPIVHDDAAMPPDTDGGAMTGMGTLEVSADVGGGTVLVDGADKGVMSSMPMGIELPVGMHSVTVRLSGYVAAEPTVTIVRNETATVNVAVGRDLTGTWDCMSDVDGHFSAPVTMNRADAVNLVQALGLSSWGLNVAGDSLSSSTSGVTISGSVGSDGRSASWLTTDRMGSYTTSCTR